jgi:hypothetical protein
MPLSGGSVRAFTRSAQIKRMAPIMVRGVGFFARARAFVQGLCLFLFLARACVQRHNTAAYIYNFM